MNIVNVILEKQYPNEYTHTMKTNVSTAVFVGAVSGQIILGSIADQLGRTKIMIISCSLLIIGGLFSALVYGGEGNYTLTLWLLVIARGLLGFGIGGEYPLAASSTVESVAPEIRLPSVTMTFSLQGLGSFTAALMSLILITLLANENNDQDYNKKNLEIIWRLLFGIGTLPAIGIFYHRWTAKESKEFRRHSISDMRKKGFELTYLERLGIVARHYKAKLFGASMTWFLLDIFFLCTINFFRFNICR